MPLKRTQEDIKKLRKEVSRLSAIANKRIKRLQKQTDLYSHALEKWEEKGGAKFGVKGKNNFEVTREYHRVKNFLDDISSTVKGAKEVNIATYQNITGLNAKVWAKTDNFFRLVDTVEKGLEAANKASLQLEYHRIWQAINQYTKVAKIDVTALQNSTDELESIFEIYAKQIKRDYTQDVLEEVQKQFNKILESVGSEITIDL